MIDDSTQRKSPAKEAFEGCLLFLCLISLICVILLGVVLILSDIANSPTRLLAYSAASTTLGTIGACIGAFQYGSKLVKDKPLHGKASAFFPEISGPPLFKLVLGTTLVGFMGGIAGLILVTTIGSLRIEYQQIWLVSSLIAIVVVGGLSFWWGQSAMEFERKWVLFLTAWIPLLSLYATVVSYFYESYLPTWSVFFSSLIGILYALFTVLYIDTVWDPERLAPRPQSCRGQFLSSAGGVLLLVLFYGLFLLVPSVRIGTHYVGDFGIDRGLKVGFSLFFLVVSTYLVRVLWKHRPRYRSYQPHMTREYPVPEPKKQN